MEVWECFSSPEILELKAQCPSSAQVRLNVEHERTRVHTQQQQQQQQQQ